LVVQAINIDCLKITLSKHANTARLEQKPALHQAKYSMKFFAHHILDISDITYTLNFASEPSFNKNGDNNLDVRFYNA